MATELSLDNLQSVITFSVKIYLGKPVFDAFNTVSPLFSQDYSDIQKRSLSIEQSASVSHRTLICLIGILIILIASCTKEKTGDRRPAVLVTTTRAARKNVPVQINVKEKSHEYL